MADLTPSQIREYARKWVSGTITPEEKELFEAWYNQQPPDEVEWISRETKMALKQRLFTTINKRLGIEPAVAKPEHHRYTIWKVAAAIILIAGISSGLYFFLKPSVTKKLDLAKDTSSPSPDSHDRYVMLSDGSTVVLHAGSSISYKENFNKTTREIILDGEAYFDVKHDSTKPFIIYTRKVRTTVLGTAFNIKAYRDTKEIVVSVTRGKVRVEDDKKVLAVLTPNHQIVYDLGSSNSVQKSIDAMAVVTDWTKKDMDFNSISFQSIAEELERRYDVTIQFKNDALKKCPIRAFFNGTESLSEVLDVLCAVRNATYVNNEKVITIDGEGCN